MRILLVILILISKSTPSFNQVPYDFENPRNKYDKIELENLVKAGVKQRKTYTTLFDNNGKETLSKELRYITKYNQIGTIVIGENLPKNGIIETQITEYKMEEIHVTDISKDLNGNIISSRTMRKDKHGKIIRTDVENIWNVDTINSKVIAYRRTKYKNGVKGYSTLYFVHSDNDSLISQDFSPAGKMIGFHNYYFDSKGNVVKEARSLGTFIYKYNDYNNEIELQEFRDEKLIERIEKTYDANHLLIQEKIIDSDNKLKQLIIYEYEYF